MTDKEANKIAEAAYQSDGPVEEFQQAHWKAEREEQKYREAELKKSWWTKVHDKITEPMDIADIVMWWFRIGAIVILFGAIGIGVLIGRLTS